MFKQKRLSAILLIALFLLTSLASAQSKGVLFNRAAPSQDPTYFNYNPSTHALGAPLRQYNVAGIVASTTQTQGQGPLTGAFNEVSVVANPNDTVTLLPAAPGISQTITNNGANTLRIFPASGDNLGLGLNAPTTLASGGATITYAAYDTTNWRLAASSASGGAVASVFGRVGAVAAQSGDYTPTQVGLGNVPNVDATNMANAASGVLAVARGGTGNSSLGSTAAPGALQLTDSTSSTSTSTAATPNAVKTAFDLANAAALTTNPLSQFAPTTSSQFAGVISDETGTGKVMFDTSPTIVTPTIASLANATHTHQNAAGGGTLDGAAIASGTVIAARLPAGTTSTVGVLQVTDSTSSTSTTTAASPNSVKTAYDLANAALPKAGGTMSGAIAMGTAKITGAGNPTAAQDVATKTYVDTPPTPGTFTEGATISLDVSSTGSRDYQETDVLAHSPTVTLTGGADGYSGNIVFKTDGSTRTATFAAAGRTISLAQNASIPSCASCRFAVGYEYTTLNSVSYLVLYPTLLDTAPALPLHASTHQNGGTDEVATATAAANAIPKAGGAGTLAIGWIPTGTTSSTVAIGNDSRFSGSTPSGPGHGSAVGRLGLNAGDHIAISGEAYCTFLGYFHASITLTKLFFNVTAGGTGAQTAEVMLATTPDGPRFANQTVTKVSAAAVASNLTTTGLFSETVSWTIAAGTNAYACIRTAMATTQPVFNVQWDTWGTGDLLVITAPGALTSFTSGTGVAQSTSRTAVWAAY